MFLLLCFLLLHDAHWSGFRPRYGSVEHESSSHLDNSVFEDAPRAMFDEDQEQQEPPPMHRSKSSLGAQSRGIFFLLFFLLYLFFFFILHSSSLNHFSFHWYWVLHFFGGERRNLRKGLLRLVFFLLPFFELHQIGLISSVENRLNLDR